MAESSLTGFILQQAFKSRKEAKAKKASQDKAAASGKKVDDKDRKGLFRKAFTNNLFGGLFGGRSATSGGGGTATGAMLGGGKKKKQKQPKGGGGKPSGGKAKGLEKILLTGFGSLVADTTAISGGLAALTEIMNSQLGIEGDMSSNLQGINAILADQLEVQTAFLDAVGGGSNSSGGGTSNTGINPGSAVTSPDSGSLIGSLLDKARDIGTGVILSRSLGIARAALTNPWVFTIGGGILAGMVASEAIKNKDPFSETPITDDPQKDAKIRESLAPTLGGNAAVRHPSYLPIGDPRRWSYDNPGKPIPPGIQAQIDAKGGPVKSSEGGINLVNKIFNQKELSASKMSSGGNMLSNFISLSMGGMTPTAIPQSSIAYPMAAGGSKAMIGEAGKEAVVPLHSADSPAKSKTGMDPSMQASAGSMLAVTDQFIKSMGPLGGPVSQALGADISNLARTFGMSQTLPNLSLGGGKFREDTTAKKGREKFLKELIAGSLEALGAKKKDGQSSPAPSSPAGPGTTGTSEERAAEDKRAEKAMDDLSGGGTKKSVTNKDGSTQEILESNAKIFGSDLYTRQVDTNGVLPGGMEAKSVKGPGLQYRPVEGTNGTRWYDVDGRIYSWQPGTTVRELKRDELTAGWNGKPFVRQLSTGHVRVNQDDWTLGGVYQRPPASGEYSYKFGQVWDGKAKDGKGDWVDAPVKGGYGGKASALPPSNNIKFEKGGVAQKPWWDFLGWVTASQEVKKGTTGIYSGSPMGRIAERTARTNAMMKELGYESGGTMTGVRAAPAPKVAPVSYAPMATAETESTDIGAIVNIVGSQAQQPIPIMPNNEGQSTSDYVAAPMGGGLAFTVLSTSQWGG